MSRTKFRRSSFLEGSAALGTIAIVRSPARGADFTYKLATNDPTGSPAITRQAQMCAAIARETNGRMSIELFPNSTLGSQTALMTQLREGVVQFHGDISANFQGVVPVAGIDAVGLVFKSPQQAEAVMDGPLGDYVRSELMAKGLYALQKPWPNGFKEVASTVRAIRTIDDFAGFKIRTPPSPINVDFYRTLGANPTALDNNQTYTALQTHLIDGVDSPVFFIMSNKWYEVMKYLSVMHAVYANYWIIANLEAWNALPRDIQTVIERNATKYAFLLRGDTHSLNDTTIAKLQAQGMIANTTDTGPMRARLRPYYQRWKQEFGPKAWSLLEDRVGRLS